MVEPHIAPAALLWAPVLVLLVSGAHAVAARAMGVGVHRLQLGLGPELARARIFGIPVVLSPLPLGASVSMVQSTDEPPPSVAGTAIDTLPAGRRALLHAAGLLPLLAVALLTPVLPSLGWLALALTAFNLLPTPGSIGGQIVLAAGEQLGGWTPSDAVLAVWALVGTAAGLSLLVGFMAWVFTA